MKNTNVSVFALSIFISSSLMAQAYGWGGNPPAATHGDMGQSGRPRSSLSDPRLGDLPGDGSRDSSYNRSQISERDSQILSLSERSRRAQHLAVEAHEAYEVARKAQAQKKAYTELLATAKRKAIDAHKAALSAHEVYAAMVHKGYEREARAYLQMGLQSAHNWATAPRVLLPLKKGLTAFSVFSLITGTVRAAEHTSQADVGVGATAHEPSEINRGTTSNVGSRWDSANSSEEGSAQ